jgi:hypothetical protein
MIKAKARYYTLCLMGGYPTADLSASQEVITHMSNLVLVNSMIRGTMLKNNITNR